MSQGIQRCMQVMGREPVIHIVEDDASLRQALEDLFQSVGHSTRTFGSTAAFIEGVDRDTPGCLVLDIRLPGVSGLDFQVRMEGLGVRLPVILMTGHGDIPMSVRGMKAGAVDFLTKPFRDQDMLDAVTEALERDDRRRTAAADTAEVWRRFSTLSPREQQVMRLVSAGRLNKQVAGDLAISEVTVKIHRGAAMRKMGARSLADLVRMADVIDASPQTNTTV